MGMLIQSGHVPISSPNECSVCIEPILQVQLSPRSSNVRCGAKANLGDAASIFKFVKVMGKLRKLNIKLPDGYNFFVSTSSG